MKLRIIIALTFIVTLPLALYAWRTRPSDWREGIFAGGR
jgi:hypothetical protein